MAFTPDLVNTTIEAVIQPYSDFEGGPVASHAVYASAYTTTDWNMNTAVNCIDASSIHVRLLSGYDIRSELPPMTQKRLGACALGRLPPFTSQGYNQHCDSMAT